MVPLQISLRGLQKIVKEHGARDASRLRASLEEMGVMPVDLYFSRGDEEYQLKRRKGEWQIRAG